MGLKARRYADKAVNSTVNGCDTRNQHQYSPFDEGGGAGLDCGAERRINNSSLIN